jgi:hypothetical protein
MLKDKNASILGIVSLAMFIMLVIYLLTQDVTLVGPI